MRLTALKPTVERRVEEDGSGLLFDADTEDMFVLNSTGVWLWAQLQPGISLASLVDHAQSAFNVPPDKLSVVSEQIVDLLLSFCASNLITFEANGRQSGTTYPLATGGSAK